MAPVALLLFYPTRGAPLFFMPVPLLWVARRRVTGRWSVPTALDGPLLAIAGMALLGYTLSPDRALSWTRLWYILLGIALVYALANWLVTARRCRWLGDALLVGSLAVVVLALVGVDWGHVRLVPLGLYRLFPTWIRNPAWGGYIPSRGQALNPRPIAMGLAVLLPVAWMRALIGGEGGQWAWRRVVAALASFVMLAMLLLLQSLQGLLGAALAASVLCLGACLRRRALGALVAFAAIGLAGSVVVSRLPYLAWGAALLSMDTPVGLGVVLRLDIWSRAWAMVRYAPWTGVGLDGYHVLQAGLYPGVLLGPESHAHNLFLQLALDLGVPGLLAFLWGLSALGRSVLLAGRRLDRELPEVRALLYGAGAGLVAYLGAGLIDSPWSLKSGLVLWVLLGICAAITRFDGGDAGDLGPVRRWSPLLLLVIAGVVTMTLYPSLWRRNLGSLYAHSVLLNADVPVDWSARAVTHLEEAAAGGWATGDTHRMLARLYAARGDATRAHAAVAAAIRADGVDPVRTYAPWEVGRARTGPWQSLVRIYDHWWCRYPEQAIWYAQTALVWEEQLDDPARAQSIRDAGMRAGAEPGVLLLAP